MHNYKQHYYLNNNPANRHNKSDHNQHKPHTSQTSTIKSKQLIQYASNHNQKNKTNTGKQLDTEQQPKKIANQQRKPQNI